MKLKIEIDINNGGTKEWGVSITAEDFEAGHEIWKQINDIKEMNIEKLEAILTMDYIKHVRPECSE